MTERSIYQYNPRIPPRREVEDRIHALIAERRGTDGEMRFGEQYICTCRCGALEVTSSRYIADEFRTDHAGCKAAA